MRRSCGRVPAALGGVIPTLSNEGMYTTEGRRLGAGRAGYKVDTENRKRNLRG